MALTKQDLEKIKTIVVETLDAGLRQYFLPLHTWSLEADKKFEIIDEKLDKLDKKADHLQKRMDDLVFDTEEKVVKNEQLLGNYANDFVNKKEFTGLEKRVEKLESTVA